MPIAVYQNGISALVYALNRSDIAIISILEQASSRLIIKGSWDNADRQE